MSETADPSQQNQQDKNLRLQAAAHTGVFLLAATMWISSDLWLQFSDVSLAKPLAFLVAIAAGIAMSHIIHEWGHYFGAVLSGGQYTVKASIHPLFFDFDYASNTPKQYLWLSAGGPIGNICLITLLWLCLPLDNFARECLFATCIGNLVYVLVLEGPVSLRIRNGENPLDVIINHFSQGAALFKRSLYWGIAAGFITLWIL